MTKIKIERISTYKNNGLRSEQDYIYTVSGQVVPHDSGRYDMGSDYGTKQIKSDGASLASGNLFSMDTFDEILAEYLAKSHSDSYVYVARTDWAYEMDAELFEIFVRTFGSLQKESAKNGGKSKIRLRHESKKMLNWLEERV